MPRMVGQSDSEEEEDERDRGADAVEEDESRLLEEGAPATELQFGSNKKKTVIHRLLAELPADTNQRVAQMLTSDLFDVNQVDFDGDSYLHYVVRLESRLEDEGIAIPLIYVFGNAGINPNLVNEMGDSPLHLAVQLKGSPLLINSLMKIGANAEMLNGKEQSALEMSKHTDDDIQRQLLIMQPNLLGALKRRDVRKVTWLLNALFKPDVIYKERFLSDIVEEDEFGVEMAELFIRQKPRILFAHACLAGDVELARNYHDSVDNIDVDIRDHSFLDDGGLLNLPLLAQCAVLKQHAIVTYLVTEINMNANLRLHLSPTIRQPIYAYAMTNWKTVEMNETVTSILSKADPTLVKKSAANFIYHMWMNKWPQEIINFICMKGDNLAARNEHGHTARDLIFLHCLRRGENWRSEIHFIDDFARQIIEEGRLEEMKIMATQSYEAMFMSRPMPVKKPKPDKKTQKMNARQLVLYEAREVAIAYHIAIPDLKTRIRHLFDAVETGNMPKYRELICDELADSRDKGGRTILHVAALFDRRFIATHIISKYPHLCKSVDIWERTPLLWAIAMDEAHELEALMQEHGAFDNDIDALGFRAHEYDGLMGEKYIREERRKMYGDDLWYKELHLRFREAIKKDNLDEVKLLCLEIQDLPLEVIVRDRYRSKGDTSDRDILFQCVEGRRDAIACYLVTHGCNYDIVNHMKLDSYEKEWLLLDAVRLRCMFDTEAAIVAREEELLEEDEKEQRRMEEIEERKSEHYRKLRAEEEAMEEARRKNKTKRSHRDLLSAYKAGEITEEELMMAEADMIPEDDTAAPTGWDENRAASAKKPPKKKGTKKKIPKDGEKPKKKKKTIPVAAPPPPEEEDEFVTAGVIAAAPILPEVANALKPQSAKPEPPPPPAEPVAPPAQEEAPQDEGPAFMDFGAINEPAVEEPPKEEPPPPAPELPPAQGPPPQPPFDPNMPPFDPNQMPPWDPNMPPFDPNQMQPWDPNMPPFDPNQMPPWDPNMPPFDPNQTPPWDPNMPPFDPNMPPFDPNMPPFDPNMPPWDPNQMPPWDPNMPPFDPNQMPPWDPNMAPQQYPPFDPNQMPPQQ